jgi:hypothetical protein
MRNNKELAEKVGLLSGMKIYKFFRVIYDYYSDEKNGINLTYIRDKIRRPGRYSYIFINNDYGYSKQDEPDFASYFADETKSKKSIPISLSKFVPESWQLIDILKMCQHFSSHNYLRKNYY